MSLNEILLVCAALFPAVALCIYVFKKDRVEKEPIGLLLLLFLVGCATCFPAGEIEGVVIAVIDEIFAPFTVSYNGHLYLSGITFKIYNACKYFIGVALVEEGVKLFALYFLTRNNKNFNSLFDGMIYSVFVSLGFAALENVMYVLRNGWVNAFTRGILAVPGHMFFAVLMGYYYSFWHMKCKARDLERRYKEQGRIAQNAVEFSGKQDMFLALLVPVLAHGWYDYCCTVGSTLAVVGLYLFVGFLYIYCFGKIKKMSKADELDNVFVMWMIYRKHPLLMRSEEED